MSRQDIEDIDMISGQPPLAAIKEKHVKLPWFFGARQGQSHLGGPHGGKELTGGRTLASCGAVTVNQ